MKRIFCFAIAAIAVLLAGCGSNEYAGNPDMNTKSDPSAPKVADWAAEHPNNGAKGEDSK